MTYCGISDFTFLKKKKIADERNVKFLVAFSGMSETCASAVQN